MIPLNAKGIDRVSVGLFDRHRHVCDFIFAGGPILSLFRDTKADWLYLWVDTDGHSVNRWLILPVNRDHLQRYLSKTLSLEQLIKKSQKLFLMDAYERSQTNSSGKSVRTITRSLFSVKAYGLIEDYLPDPDSFFDEEFAPDVDLSHAFLPSEFNIPIDGSWFMSDLNKFGRVYSQLYAFFYCTQPRFISNISEKLRANLFSSWRGGSNRVHLFEDLKNHIPAMHDLRIDKLQYASPGSVTIEALESVGDSIKGTVLNYVKKEISVLADVKSLNGLLDSADLRKKDLSKYTDDNLPVDPQAVIALQMHSKSITDAIGITNHHKLLCSEAPNSVVSTKVLLALVSRLGYLVELQKHGLLDYQ